MNKNEFTKYISEKHEITQKEAKELVDKFTNSVVEALREGKDINLTGFGSFSVSEIKARDGRNPRTGEIIKIPSYKQPKFKVGKYLKDAVN